MKKLRILLILLLSFFNVIGNENALSVSVNLQTNIKITRFKEYTKQEKITTFFDRINQANAPPSANLVSFITSPASYTVTNPGLNADIFSNLNTTVSMLANSGDTLSIPTCSVTMTYSITTSKRFVLRGAGQNNSIIYRSESTPDDSLAKWGTMFHFLINYDRPSGIIVYNLTLKSRIGSSTNDGDGKSISKDRGLRFTKCVDFVVHDCHFENFGEAHIAVYHKDDIARGLIYKCSFLKVKGKGLGEGYGVVVYGQNLRWIPHVDMSSDNFIVIEDCTFELCRHSVAAGGGALYNFRHNYVLNNITGDDPSIQGADAHCGHGGSLGGENYFGTRAIIVAYNKFTNTLFQDGTTLVNGQSIVKIVERCIMSRSGEALIYNDTITGYRFGIAIGPDVFPWGTSYPLRYATGWDSNQKYGVNHTGIDAERGQGDLFYWNIVFNTYAQSGSASTGVFYSYQDTTTIYKNGRDWHNVAKKNYVESPYPDRRRKLMPN